MKIKIRSFQAVALLVSALMLTLGGCATLHPDPAQSLQKQISQLAEAKIDKDWARVYDFFCSGFKKQIKKEDFLKSSKVTFKSYTVEKFDLAPSNDTADVTVKYDTVVMGYDLSGMKEYQHWIKENGKWVLDVKPTRGFIN